MKIVQISASMHGGAGIAAYRLHQGLLNSHEANSFFLQKDQIEGSPKQVYKCEPYYPLQYKIKKLFKATSDDFYNKEINKFPADYEIVSIPVAPFRIEDHPLIKEADIIQLHWVANFINYPTFFRKTTQPIVWTLHDMNPFQGLFHYEEDKTKNKATLGALDERVYKEKLAAIHSRNNITVVTPSEWLKQKSEASEILGRYLHRTISNGLDLSLYPLLDRKKQKQEIQVDNEKKTILFLAHLTENPRKGFDLLQEAIDKMDNTNFNLISVGGKKIPINNRIKHIHFNNINEVSRINKIYAAADITILPSREDNLPNVMLESLANGTPVLSFANGGMAEHLTTGINGIIVSEISSEALRKNMNDFLNNKYTFDNEKIRQYAFDHFSEHLQTERYISLYKEILNK